ncbi:phage tail protein [Paenibacillus woosongensis]|uniref:phage tail protein n=1 Tax=Paenibacillus woosongensis TaxID=307580 RepID=UPI0039B6F1C0
MEIPPASVTEAGIVKLSSATNSTSETLAATPRAVKSAYDAATAAQTTANAANTAAATAQSRADSAFQLGNERKAEVVAALVAKGISASTSESWDTLITKLNSIVKATGNAVAADVLSGKTFSNVSANNLTGSMPNWGAGGTVTPGTTNQTKAAGYYSSPITILGEPNLKSEYIKNGISMFGVAGSYTMPNAVVDLNYPMPELYYYMRDITVPRIDDRLILTIPAGVTKLSFLASSPYLGSDELISSTYVYSATSNSTKGAGDFSLSLKDRNNNYCTIYRVSDNRGAYITHYIYAFVVDLKRTLTSSVVANVEREFPRSQAISRISIPEGFDNTGEMSLVFKSDLRYNLGDATIGITRRAALRGTLLYA